VKFIKKWLDAKPQHRRLRRYLLFFVYPGCFLVTLLLWLSEYLSQTSRHLDGFFLFHFSIAVFFYFMFSVIWVSIRNRIGKVVCGVAWVVFSSSPIALIIYFIYAFIKPLTYNQKLLKLARLPNPIGYPIPFWGCVTIVLLLVVGSIIWLNYNSISENQD